MNNEIEIKISKSTFRKILQKGNFVRYLSISLNSWSTLNSKRFPIRGAGSIWAFCKMKSSWYSQITLARRVMALRQAVIEIISANKE